MCRLIVCCALLFLATDVMQAALTRLSERIKVHKGKVVWDEARDQCEREGAVLASPINAKALNAMKSVIGDQNITYYIGTKSAELPGQFVSVEGIALEDMPPAVTLDMIEELDQWEGECLAMSRDSIRSVPCTSRLPYMCYSTDVYNMNRTNCGLAEDGYKYHVATGHCYKLHKEAAHWDEAHGVCVSEGGFLVIIENAEQAQIIQSMGDWTHHGYMYIGVHRLFNKYGYFSVHGQPVEELYDDWHFTVERMDPTYPCGALFKTGKWTNIRCSYTLHFVCQKEPTI